MRLKHAIAVFLLIAVILSGFSGCDKSDDAYIYYQMPDAPFSLDPQTASSEAELTVIRNLFEGLMRTDENGNTVCGVCESFDQNGKVYTFHIRKNAVWNNGEDLTANDFVFAFRRALEPKTKAPFADRLSAISNASRVLSGSLSSDKLGIKAIDNKTVEITLEKEDEYFLKSLATSVAMPCNTDFFEKASGKYGLQRDCIMGNGSYRLGKWDKTTNGIRLYRNEKYTGKFIAKNAAVFMTASTDETVLSKLKKNSVDIGFIDCTSESEMKNNGFTVKSFQNICWFMTLSTDFPARLRKSLLSMVNSEIYGKELMEGYTVATSVFPGIITDQPISSGMAHYDPQSGKKQFALAISDLEEKKFPSGVIMKYYDNGSIKPVITSVVGHWQNNLSAFVNIEEISSPEFISDNLAKKSKYMAFFPIKADSEKISEYLKKFGISGISDPATAQSKILKNSDVMPIAFQNTVVCATKNISHFNITPENGYIDFSFIVKTD